MAVIAAYRTARTRRVCDGPGAWGVRHHIEPGERYQRHAATPHDNDLGNTGWWVLNLCPACMTPEPTGARS